MKADNQVQYKLIPNPLYKTYCHFVTVCQSLQDHGLFLCGGFILSLCLFRHYNGIILIVWSLYSIRLAYLEKSVLWAHVSLLGLVVLLSLTLWKPYLLPYESGRYLVKIDPYQINQTTHGYSGIGQIWTNNKWVKVYWVSQSEEFDQLDRVVHLQVKGEIQAPSPARNFGVFDFSSYLQSKDIEQQLSIDQINQIIPAEGWGDIILNWRIKFLAPFRKADSNPIFSIYNRLIWNLDSWLYDQWRDNLMTLGIIHFFALSGLHVSLLLKKVDYWLRRIGVTIEWSVWITLVLGILYCFLTGFPVGVVRSLAMVILGRTTKLSRLDRLSMVAICYLIFCPGSVFYIGFVLSYLLSLVLILCEEASFPPMMSKSAWIGVICLLFTWPLTIGSHYYWYPLQVVWALLFGVLFDRLIWPFSLTMTALVGLNITGFQLNLDWMSQGLDLLDQLSPALLIGKIPVVLMILMILAAGYCLENIKMGLIVSVLLYSLLVFGSGKWHGARLILLDVGQGDALVVQELVSNEAILIDTGGKPLWGPSATASQAFDQNYAQKNLLPALKALGIQRLEAVIITHPDIDHMGNLKALLDHFSINQMIVSPLTEGDQIFQQLVAGFGGPIRVVEDGTSIYSPNLSIYNIASEKLNQGDDQSNRSSLVVKVTLGEVKLLNMGDLPIEEEKILIQQVKDLSSHILKVGHHGSSTSTSQVLLDRVNPQLAFISAGLNNRYGHPHDEVLTILDKQGIQVLQTNKNGAIKLEYWPIIGWQLDTAIKESDKK